MKTINVDKIIAATRDFNFRFEHDLQNGFHTNIVSQYPNTVHVLDWACIFMGILQGTNDEESLNGSLSGLIDNLGKEIEKLKQNILKAETEVLFKKKVGERIKLNNISAN